MVERGHPGAGRLVAVADVDRVGDPGLGDLLVRLAHQRRIARCFSRPGNSLVGARVLRWTLAMGRLSRTALPEAACES
jgi:hypothetical protein